MCLGAGGFSAGPAAGKLLLVFSKAGACSLRWCLLRQLCPQATKCMVSLREHTMRAPKSSYEQLAGQTQVQEEVPQVLPAVMITFAGCMCLQDTWMLIFLTPAPARAPACQLTYQLQSQFKFNWSRWGCPFWSEWNVVQDIGWLACAPSEKFGLMIVS